MRITGLPTQSSPTSGMYVAIDNGTTTQRHNYGSFVSSTNSSISSLQNALTPSIGTVNYQINWAPYSTGRAVMLKKVGNMVSLIGCMTYSGADFTSSTTEVTMFTIPSGYRPPAIVDVLCQGSGTNLWVLRINPNGDVTMSRYRNAAGTYQQVTSSIWLPFSASWIVS